MTILFYFLSIILAITAYHYDLAYIFHLADNITIGFTTIIKWFAIPLVSLSILSTTSKLESKKELFSLGGKVFKYTILTTVIAASIGLLLFLVFHPHANISGHHTNGGDIGAGFGELLTASVFLTLVLSVFLVSNKSNFKYKIEQAIDTSYKYTMLSISKILLLMPVAVWAFMVQFLRHIDMPTMQNLGIYLACVVAANLIQAFVVLPVILRFNNIEPIKLFKQMFEALNVAFWAKSSSIALPVALKCAKENSNVDPKIANFSLPLCITVNMNGCAAFILITVLFISTSNGFHYSAAEYLLWVMAATIAAIGNAGVPMGCYTISGAILAYMGVPLYLLGLILPFYSLIDMLESAINVWSDSCVTKLVDCELIDLKGEAFLGEH